MYSRLDAIRVICSLSKTQEFQDHTRESNILKHVRTKHSHMHTLARPAVEFIGAHIVFFVCARVCVQNVSTLTWAVHVVRNWMASLYCARNFVQAMSSNLASQCSYSKSSGRRRSKTMSGNSLTFEQNRLFTFKWQHPRLRIIFSPFRPYLTLWSHPRML